MAKKLNISTEVSETTTATEISMEAVIIPGLTQAEEAVINNSIEPGALQNAALNNSLKLMSGKYGGGFYVNFVQDDASGRGWLRLVIQHPDDSCKPIILYKNTFRETSFNGNGFWDSNAAKVVVPKNSKYVPAYGEGLVEDWNALEKYATPQMPIPGRIIWKLIQENYEAIPIVKINNTITYEELYTQMAQYAIEVSKCPDFGFVNSKDRYYIPSDDFKSIITENGLSLNDVRAAFDMMGLFIKDKNAGGYQYSKRVYGKLIRYYALKKNVPVPKEKNIKELENLEYSTDVKTRAEREIERLTKKNKELYEAAQKAVDAKIVDCKVLL